MDRPGERDRVRGDEVLGHEPVGDRADAEVLVGPRHEALVPGHGVAALTGLVAFASDQQQLVTVGRGRSTQRTLRPVVRQVHAGWRRRLDLARHHVGRLRFGEGKEESPVEERQAGGHHRPPSLDRAMVGVDPDALGAVAHATDPDLLAHRSTPIGDLGGHVVQERHGVELRLVGEADGTGGCEREAGGPDLCIQPDGGEQLDLPFHLRRGGLLECVRHRGACLPSAVHVPCDPARVEPVESVPVGLEVRQGRGSVTGRLDRLGGQIVQDRHLRRAVAGRPVGDGSGLEHDDVDTLFGQSDRGREAGDAGADHDAVGPLGQFAVGEAGPSPTSAIEPERLGAVGQRRAGDGAVARAVAVVRGIRGSLVRRAPRPAGSERAQGIPAAAGRDRTDDGAP